MITRRKSSKHGSTYTNPKIRKRVIKFSEHGKSCEIALSLDKIVTDIIHGIMLDIKIACVVVTTKNI